jgi:ADP-heptose:LPS heptosyltransferase
MNTPRRIAILRPLFLGDLLCAVPAFRSLRQRFPSAEITLIGLPWAQEFIARCQYLDRLLPFGGWPGIPEVVVDPERIARFVDQAQAARFDLALQMHGTGRTTNDIVAALGARFAAGYGPDGDSRLDIVLPWRDEDHEIDRCLRIVGALGGEVTDRHLEFTLSPGDDGAALRSFGTLPGPIIGLHPGAKEPARRWPPEHFAELGNTLAHEIGARLVITGTAGEANLARVICDRLTVPALDLTGRTDLGGFAAVIKRLDLLVTNDTGASHLAAAFRTPSVVLFGPTRPDRWAPLNSRLHHVVDACALLAAVSPERALREIPVDPVFAACAAMLAERPESAGDAANDLDHLVIRQEAPWTAA